MIYIKNYDHHHSLCSRVNITNSSALVSPVHRERGHHTWHAAHTPYDLKRYHVTVGHYTNPHSGMFY